MHPQVLVPVRGRDPIQGSKVRAITEDYQRPLFPKMGSFEHSMPHTLLFLRCNELFV